MNRRERAQKLVEVGAIQPDRACLRKNAYANQNDARHAAKGMALAYDRTVETYKCPFCPNWHLTKLSHGEDAA